jgi:VanZ family protein
VTAASEARVTLGLARSVFAGLLLVSLVMFLLPAEDLSPNAPNDKVTHLLTFAALALAGRWAVVPVLPLLAGLTAYAAATEVLQAVLPINRHGDVRDLLADFVGVLVGLAASWAVVRWRSRVPGSG